MKPYEKKRSFKDKFTSDAPWKKSFGGRDNGRSALHPAVCSKCGKECVLPFKPNGKKPVFCTSCFKQESTSDADRFDRPSAGRRYDDDRGDRKDSLNDQLKTINNKLDAILASLISQSDDGKKPTRYKTKR